MRFKVWSVGQEKPRGVAGLGLYTSRTAFNIACSAETHLDGLWIRTSRTGGAMIVWCVGGCS